MEMKLKLANMRSEKSFIAALHDLELFNTISGLKLNNKKTEALWIGSCTGRED